MEPLSSMHPRFAIPSQWELQEVPADAPGYFCLEIMNWHFLLLFTAVTLTSVWSQFNPLSLEELGSDIGIQVFNHIVKARPQENIVVSPHGIASVLGILQLGADGKTKKQLTTVMRYSVNGVGKVLKKINKAIVSKKNKDIVTVANAMFVKSGFKTEVPFVTRNKEVFQCSVKTVDFEDQNAACNSINQWVKNETRGMIDNLLSPDIIDGALTRLVLVNAVYFKGLWKSRFQPENTKKRTFNGADGKTYQVPMLAQLSLFRCGTTSTPNDLWYNIIELPYHGESISMLIALPTESTTPLSAIIPHISTKTIQSWMTTMIQKRVQVILPKLAASVVIRSSNCILTTGQNPLASTMISIFTRIARCPIFDQTTQSKRAVKSPISGAKAGSLPAMGPHSSRKQQHVPTPAPNRRGSQGAQHDVCAPSAGSAVPIGWEPWPMGDAGAVSADGAAHTAAWPHLCVGAGEGTCRCFQELIEERKAFMYLIFCKKQKLKLVKMEPKLLQQQNRKRAPAWTEQEVWDLITVWGEESVLSELRSSFRNAKTFVKIYQGMKVRGHNRDLKQCRVKLKELRQAYQKTREANGRSGSEPKTCRFYDELHAILGGSATTTPTVLFDSFNGDGGNTEAEPLPLSVTQRRGRPWRRLRTEMAAEIHARPQSSRPVLLSKVEGHQDAVSAALLIPKEDGLITASEDRTIRVWLKRDSGQYWPSIYHTMSSPCSAMAYHHDSRRIFVGQDNGAIMEFHISEDFNKMNFVKTYPGKTQFHEFFCTFRYDIETNHAFVGDYSGQITLLKLEQNTCTVITTLKGHEGSVASLWWDPVQRLLFSGASDHSIILWDIGGRKGRTLLLQGHHDKVQAICYIQLTRQLISCSADGGIAVWNMDVSREEHHCRKCGQAVCGKCSTKRSSYPIMGFEFQVRVCDSCFESIKDEDRTSLATFHEGKHNISHMSMDISRGLMVTCGSDRIVKIWDMTPVVGCSLATGFSSH
ncbi:WD repeat and FYVE domain-containing protein 1 [Chelonia mydas]|uniref:WD repeat and FYVE domain-containing protein 1 n=1 Tax=Chelonia mydas TaxID=8469 RepID=M7BYX1_CHEMY|nr:WD repeat and FYVE domain-containing protein 1 [Chelonia mydas]